jgi:hypothetical protein
MTERTPREPGAVGRLDRGALAAIDVPARRAERRLRLGRALATATTAACVALVLAVVTLALRKVGVVQERPARVVLCLLALATVAAAVLGWTRPLAARAGAVALDRFHGLHDRLSSALSFAALPAAEQTPFMAAASRSAAGAA